MILYVLVLYALSCLAVSWGLHGLAAFGLSSMVVALLACVFGAMK